MGQEKEDREVHTLWVDREARVLSFHEEEGLAEVRFPSREEMLAFAVEKSGAGFGVQ